MTAAARIEAFMLLQSSSVLLLVCRNDRVKIMPLARLQQCCFWSISGSGENALRYPNEVVTRPLEAC